MLLISMFLVSIFPVFLILRYKFKQLVKIEFVNFDNNNKDQTDDNHKQKILLTGTEIGFGGREIATLNLYKELIANNFKVIFLIAKNSISEEKLNKEKIPYYKCYTKKIFGMHWFFGQKKQLQKILLKEKIEIIHMNSWKETFICKAANKKHNIPIFLTQHDYCRIKPYVINNLTGIFAVNEELVDIIKSVKTKNNLKIRSINFLPPFYDPKPFLNFSKTSEKEKFFTNNFNLNLQNIPLISCIGNICKRKNQTLLLKAMHKLIHRKNIPFQTIFAGRFEGNIKEEIIQLITDLKLKNFAHFVGFTDKIAEIVFHSDISVFPFNQEPFGIVYLEAALMKKTIITTENAGSKNIIIPNETGLFFEANNSDDLADKIEFCLNNKNLCHDIGKNAFNIIQEKFMPDQTISKLKKLYKYN